jgi:antitoxin component of MazEF toxin-antitoxin module
VRFRATIGLAGKTATGIRVPAEVVESLGAGKKPPVRVTINGTTYRSTIASRSGQYLVGVSAENRELTGVAAGDEVDVDIELDTEPREVVVPTDLAKALDAEPQARQFFESLSFSQKQGYVLPIEQAKKSETRERRVEKAIEMLRQGRNR